jgi:hypothetical protein
MIRIIRGVSSGGKEAFNDGAIESNGTNHFNCEMMWKPATDFTIVFCHFWIRMLLNGSGSIVSDGYGGRHALLFQVNGDEVNGYQLTGNFYNTTSGVSKSFYGREKFKSNEWQHIAVGYDMQNIVCYLQGVPSLPIPYNLVRNTDLNVGSGVFFGLGSDHAMAIAQAKRGQIFEDVIPLETLFAAFDPPDVFTDTFQKVNGDLISSAWLMDFSNINPKGLIPDDSSGLHGRKHPARLAAFGVNGVSNEIGQWNDAGKASGEYPLRGGVLPKVIPNAPLPNWLTTQQFAGGIAPAAIPGAVFGSTFFNAPDKTLLYVNSNILGLPNSDIGNAVARDENGAAVTRYGVIKGNCFQNSTSGACLWDCTSKNRRFVIRRPHPDYKGQYLLYARWLNASSHLRVYVDSADGYDVAYIQTPNGASTLGSHAFTAPQRQWTELEIDVSANDALIFKINGASVLTISAGNGISLFTGTQFGWEFSNSMPKISQWAAI